MTGDKEGGRSTELSATATLAAASRQPRTLNPFFLHSGYAKMRVPLLLGSVVLILMAYSAFLLHRMLCEIHHGKDSSEQSQQDVQTPQLTRSANQTSGFKL